jgi:hypothetical protein
MTKNDDIAKALKTRLSELTRHLAEIDSELRKPLSADSEERATDLENQDALEGIKNSEIQEIGQIQGALMRIFLHPSGPSAPCGRRQELSSSILNIVSFSTKLCGSAAGSDYAGLGVHTASKSSFSRAFKTVKFWQMPSILYVATLKMEGNI